MFGCVGGGIWRVICVFCSDAELGVTSELEGVCRAVAEILTR